MPQKKQFALRENYKRPSFAQGPHRPSRHSISDFQIHHHLYLHTSISNSKTTMNTEGTSTTARRPAPTLSVMPPEVRLLIYRHLFEPILHINRLNDLTDSILRDGTPQHLEIVEIDRITYDEAMPIAYRDCSPYFPNKCAIPASSTAPWPVMPGRSSSTPSPSPCIRGTGMTLNISGNR